MHKASTVTSLWLFTDADNSNVLLWQTVFTAVLVKKCTKLSNRNRLPHRKKICVSVLEHRCQLQLNYYWHCQEMGGCDISMAGSFFL